MEIPFHLSFTDVALLSNLADNFFDMTGLTPFFILIAPIGQLCGNGQLRETISERRKRKGEDVAFWYLPPNLVQLFQISGPQNEAVVAEEKTAINWLQLRFGGTIIMKELSLDDLRDKAMELPPAPPSKDISISSN